MQGSILGPFLFLLYINGLIIMFSKPSLFADDTKQWCLWPMYSLQSDLDALSLWSTNWKLMFNETNVLCFLLPLMLLRIITIPSWSISSTDSLSPHVTNKKTLVYLYLSWSHHISGIISKAYKSLYSASVLTQRLKNLHWGTIVSLQSQSALSPQLGTDKRFTGY